jgi:hypothetical protein
MYAYLYCRWSTRPGPSDGYGENAYHHLFYMNTDKTSIENRKRKCDSFKSRCSFHRCPFHTFILYITVLETELETTVPLNTHAMQVLSWKANTAVSTGSQVPIAAYCCHLLVLFMRNQHFLIHLRNSEHFMELPCSQKHVTGTNPYTHAYNINL